MLTRTARPTSALCSGCPTNWNLHGEESTHETENGKDGSLYIYWSDVVYDTPNVAHHAINDGKVLDYSACNCGSNWDWILCFCFNVLALSPLRERLRQALQISILQPLRSGAGSVNFGLYGERTYNSRIFLSRLGNIIPR